MRKEELYYDETPITKEYLDAHYKLDEQETDFSCPQRGAWYYLWNNFHLIWGDRGVFAEDAPYLRLETVGDLALLHRILRGK